MVILLLIVIGVAGIAIEALSQNNDLVSEAGHIVGIAALVIGGFMLIIACCSYPLSLNTVSDMENFFERNNRIFSEAVVAFPDATTVKTSDNTTETVRLSWDYTKEVLAYNENLKWYQRYQSNWFIDFFVTTVPEKLKYIELKK